MTHHYPDLGSASDWSCRLGNLIQPIRCTTQIWVVTGHQCGISALISQTSGKPVVASPNVGCFLRLPVTFTSLFVYFWCVASHDIHQTDSLLAGYKHCSTYSVKCGNRQSMQVCIKLEYFAYTLQKYCITDMPRAWGLRHGISHLELLYVLFYNFLLC